MSFPQFPSTPSPSPTVDVGGGRGGAGDRLPTALLGTAAACTFIATGLGVMSVVLQLKNYRNPALQRCVVRIMVMVPLYACSSLIALYSLNAAFFIDAIRDLYEAFVIYAFLQLLLTYLGGERDLLLRLRGRPPIPHPFPFNIFMAPMDPSDPWVLLNLKRGVLQYVQIKPFLVIVTIIAKATGTYNEGEFTLTSGYTYITLVYNFSICLSLYCLAMFWVAVNPFLTPFRPVPKFLCVKGILFFSFWQGVAVSFLISVRAIKRVGPYTDPEHMSLALVDSMVCFEMPFFAIAHQYAFRASDYINPTAVHVARLPFYYAFRDAFGLKDVWEDIKYTFKARGVSYKAYEAADGGIHSEAGRQKRIRAGLRYAKGGKVKYWVPVPGADVERDPLLPRNGVDRTMYTRDGDHGEGGFESSDSELSDAASLEFSSTSETEDAMYARARRVGYSGFPNVDISREQKRRKQRDEEDGILAGRRTRRGTESDAPLSPDSEGPSTPSRFGRRSLRNKSSKGKGKMGVYGAWADRVNSPGDPTVAEVDDAPFDGENENPGAWRSEENATSLRWTSKQLSRGQEPKTPSNRPPNLTLPPQGLAAPKQRSPGLQRSPGPRPDAVDLVPCESPPTDRSPEEVSSPVAPTAAPISVEPVDRPDAVDLIIPDEVIPSPETDVIAPRLVEPPSPAPMVEPGSPTLLGKDTAPSTPGNHPAPLEQDAVAHPKGVRNTTPPPRMRTPPPEPSPVPAREDRIAPSSDPSGSIASSFPPRRSFSDDEESDKDDDDDSDDTDRGHSREASSGFGAASFRAPSYRWSRPEDNPWA